MVGATILAALAFQAAPQGAPEIVTRTRVDPARGVDFHAMIVPDTVYVGQQATYQLGVFLDQDTRQRIRRNPEFQPPETRSLLSYDLRDRDSGPQSATIGGRAYETHVFRRALFAMAPGRYPIPQARLTYSLPQTSSFFSREETFTLRSEAVTLVAVAPPAAGRPAEWAGAVGSWRAVARIDTARGRAGDPFVFTVRVEGQGNVTLLPRPRIDVPWASVVNADERVVLDSSPPRLGGWKEFDWLLTPTMPGAHRVPPVRYAYFNPRTRRYETTVTAPIAVRVAAGAVAAVAAPVAAPPLRPPPIAASLGGDAPAALGRSVGAIVLVAIAPLLAFAVIVARRPRKPRPAPTPAERIAAAAAMGGAAGARVVRQAVVDGLARRTGVNASACTAPGALTVELRKAGVTPETAGAVERLMDSLDIACFGPDGPGAGDWAARGRDVLRRVDVEACAPRGGGARTALLGSALLVLAAVIAGPVAAQSAADAFAMGATAYAGGDYARAARHFADAAHAAPRSAAAWENLGTAAMLANDTAMAVVGWQRALRLDPLDRTIRARLASVRAPQENGPAWVPPVPEWAAAGLALLIWVGGWGAVAWLAWRRRPLWHIAALTIVVGGAAIVLAVRLERALSGRDLVVVAAPAPLRALPALGADTRATPLVGEVADVVARQGVWVHVRLDGGREGWVPAERVTPLGGD